MLDLSKLANMDGAKELGLLIMSVMYIAVSSIGLEKHRTCGGREDEKTFLRLNTAMGVAGTLLALWFIYQRVSAA